MLFMQESMDTRWYSLGEVANLVKLDNVSFREYQHSIVQKIMQGKNTLVVLPTGLGKTLIGTLVLASALAKGKKAMFLSPTKPLTEQHYSTLVESLNVEKDQILLLTGSLAKNRRKEMEEHARIIIATPQTVANELKNANFDMSQFGVVVFDECHKAVGKYAYTYIAEEADLKGVQMVGLTASPGSAREKIKSLLNELKIQDIEIRISTDPDVATYVMPKYMHVLEVDRSERINRIALQLRPLAEDALKKLNTMGLTPFRMFETMPKGRLIELGNMINKIEARNFKFGALYQYSKLLNLIHAYDLLETQGLYSFSQYLRSLRERETKSKAVQAIIDHKNVILADQLAQEGMQRGEEHPKAFALVDLLKMNHAKKAIVFVQYRSTIKMLTDLLNKNNLSARAFVGKKDGVTQAQQQLTIKEFREGKFNVLVSSSIGEEGLDIPSVDIVVFYEPIASEIRNIQRRGRTGRLYSGDVYVLMTRDTKDQVYLMVSKQKEKKMLETVTKIKQELALKHGPDRRQSRLGS
ncbi:MAG: DEAD/DEAH box helicase [Candidatus Micrarchaeota archaeon]|nr:DEAD/DEAH box helicase [Candidatus Micrarchaeota archaeon]